jgi:2-polyprenyl-3-methyl-5-hydroxy-6-metoxy-1,4-benzoquinol methylase
MTGEPGVSNIEYAQADIMAMADYNRRFDLIECVGVL